MEKNQNGSFFPFNPAQRMSTFVNSEIEMDGDYHPNLGGVTKGGLSNHYLMTIITLHELGATDEEIKRFKNSWL